MGWWTGNRTDTQELKSISDLRTPRDAFVSFITSANIARAGREDAWGLVQNAAEFEAPDEMMTRLQSLEYIREYFKLIDLTTFNWWSLPTTTTKDSIDLELEQLQSNAVLTVTLRRNAQRADCRASEEIQEARLGRLSRVLGHAHCRSSRSNHSFLQEMPASYPLGFEVGGMIGRSVDLHHKLQAVTYVIHPFYFRLE